MKTKLFILFTIIASLLFSNCQTEDNGLDANTHSKFSMKKISFEEMKSKPKAVEALNKIRETKKTAGAQARLVYDSANDFYVDTEEIIYIEKGGDYHSYTFAVYRDVETPLFENLVMSLQKDGSYSATLVSYNLTEQERADLEKEKLFSLEGKLAVKILDPGTYNPEYLLGRTNCYNVNVATCSWHGVHIAGPRCKPDGVATIRVCYEYEEPVFYFDDSAIGDAGGGGTGDSGGGGGTGNPNPTPNPDPTPDPDPDNEEPEDELGDAPITIPLIKNPKPEKIINLLPEPCQKEIVTDVYNVCSELNSAYLEIFSSSDSHNVTYVASTTIASNASTFPINEHHNEDGSIIYSYQVAIRQSYLDTATDLSIARTIIHENIHAMLLFLKKTGFIPIMDNNPTFNELLDAYIDAYVAAGFDPVLITSPAEHQFMTKFVGKIASALKGYGMSKGYNLSDQYYNAMAWGGLHTTPLFQELYPQFDENGIANPEYKYITATIFAEQNNTAIFDSNNNPVLDMQGNQIEAKGEPCP